MDNQNLFESTYNPDVLSCIANLSNDEVFTPPEIANKMLDMLPQELFKSSKTKFLDPACKSGVFLREIAKRLLVGLQDEIPDLQERINHIFKNQVFGIAITELTSLLSRRSVYCSKYPNCKYSVCQFDENDAQGNIYFSNIKHFWINGKCLHCGASQKEYSDEKRENLESHAYQFIHKEGLGKLENMKFDVIIGNPPYQMNDGGGEGNSAKPIYHLFILQAKKLNPKYMCFIIPARWYAGGKGLDSFRDEMLNDERIKILHDYPETKDCFPGVNIRGGICYFLWENEFKGQCEIYNHFKNEENFSKRYLLEEKCTTFIRYNKAISILNKIKKEKDFMDSKVSSRLPFGIPSNFENYSTIKTAEKDIVLYRSDRSNSEKIVYIGKEHIYKNFEWKDRIKVLVSKASPGGDEYPHSIISTPILAEKNSVCTETYLIVDFVKNENEGINLISYMKTHFFRFLMSLVKNTQNISKNVFQFVPIQDFSKPWTDEELYKKYNLTQEEIDFIESMIRPMS